MGGSCSFSAAEKQRLGPTALKKRHTGHAPGNIRQLLVPQHLCFLRCSNPKRYTVWIRFLHHNSLPAGKGQWDKKNQNKESNSMSCFCGR